MNSWQGMDRRKFPRVIFPCLLKIRTEGEEATLTHTDNLGIGGVCITFKKNLKMFSSVDLELDLLDHEDLIKCQGKVVWSIRRRNDDKTKPMFYDIGVEFVDLDDKDRQRLEKTIQGLARNPAQAADS